MYSITVKSIFVAVSIAFMGMASAMAAESAPTKPVSQSEQPAPGQRLVKTGTAKMQCPGGTDKYCDGNKCGCWTQNE